MGQVSECKSALVHAVWLLVQCGAQPLSSGAGAVAMLDGPAAKHGAHELCSNTPTARTCLRIVDTVGVSLGH